MEILAHKIQDFLTRETELSNKTRWMLIITKPCEFATTPCSGNSGN